MGTMRALLVLLLGGLLLTAAAACGGGDDDEQTPEAGSPTSTSQATTGDTPSANEQAYSGVVVTTEHVVGENRFSVGVIDNAESAPIGGADVDLRFFKVSADGQGELRSEAAADEVSMQRGYIDEETGELVASGEISVYVAYAEFDEAGDWGVEITGTVDGNEIGAITLGFQVQEPDAVLSVGDPAPKSKQALASDVDDTSEIDSMVPPDPMHDLTIEDAVTSGSPSVILFGTPAFCETQTCGPIMQAVMLPLYEQYREQANFIHVEPYFLEAARSGVGFCAVPAFNAEFARQGIGEGSGTCEPVPEADIEAVGQSWNLTVEPVIFVVDSEGIIAGKFQAVTGLEEVEAVLTPLLSG